MKNKPIWDFPVELVPSVNGFHLMRTDINEKISFVTNQYNLITHREAVDMVEQQFKKFGVVATQHKFNLFGTSKTSLQMDYIIGKKILIVKDDYRLAISITNGYDRLTKFSLQYGLIRLVCTNGMVSREPIFKMSIRHLGEMFESIEKFLQKGEDFVKHSTKEFQLMLRTKPILEPVLVTKKEYNTMTDMKLFEQYFDELGKNMYAEFQAYTDYFSHHLIGNKKYKYERDILPNFVKLLNV